MTARTLTARDAPWGSAATTLEDAIADFAIARMAARHGDAATARAMLRRAGRWRALLDPAARLVRPRRADGSFVPVPPTAATASSRAAPSSTRGSCRTTRPGSRRRSAARGVAARRLDAFFAQLNAGPASAHAFLGNEPGLGTPWLYALARAAVADAGRRAAGAAASSTARRRAGCRATTTAGRSARGGRSARSGSTRRCRARTSSSSGRRCSAASSCACRASARCGSTRRAPPADGPTSTSLRLDGQAHGRPWLRVRDLRGGARLRFALGARPDRAWGARAADAPPSFPPPGTGPG